MSEFLKDAQFLFLLKKGSHNVWKMLWTFLHVPPTEELMTISQLGSSKDTPENVLTTLWLT